MTIEEAIRNLGLPKIFDAPNLAEAVKMAVAALRAQQEPVKLDRSRWEGCEVCLTVGTPENWEDGIKYCPVCGKPITEEAWAEMERRINDGKTD